VNPAAARRAARRGVEGAARKSTALFGGGSYARAERAYFVEIRHTLGGPAPEETARAAKASRQQLEADESWWSNATEGLTAAERMLADRSAAL